VTPTSLQEDIPPIMPAVRRFIEDEAREWRELDYQIQVVYFEFGQYLQYSSRLENLQHLSVLS
jgi:hypothetical protein